MGRDGAMCFLFLEEVSMVVGILRAWVVVWNWKAGGRNE